MNPIEYQEIDPTYWVFMITGIPGFMKGGIAVIFDIVLLTSCLLSCILPRQRVSAIIFFCCYFLYFVLFNMTAGHHYANIAILVISFAFVFSDKLFGFSLQFSRFAFLFIMCSAACWKIARGNLFYPHQLDRIMLSHNLGYLMAGYKTTKYQLLKWFIQHPRMTHCIWVTMIIMEFSFIIGFFTMKKDKLLLIIYILFVIGGYFLTGIFALENLLFLFILYPSFNFISGLPVFNNEKIYRLQFLNN